MQLPSTRTPVARCLELAYYTSRMLSKFPERPALLELARRLGEGVETLDAADKAYQAVRRELIEARVDVGFADHQSDRVIRRTHKQAEIEDGQRGGRIVTQVFPGGMAKITRLVGNSQVAAMRKLEARLQSSQDIWPGASRELVTVTASRLGYETALDNRQAAAQKLHDLRTARDAARERFLDLYSEVVSRVKAEFPRNTSLQNLFFDDVYVRTTGEVESGNDNRDPAEPVASGNGAAIPANPTAASG